jgi:alpha-beta hydrolase superfamily lysophospholipase
MHIESFSDLVSDLADIASATSAATGKPWVLYGHSIGGLIATSYLVDHTSPVPNLAVLSAPALGDGTPAIKRAAAKILGGIVPRLTMKTPIAGEQLSSNPKVGEAYDADPLVQQFGTIGFGKEVFAEQKRVAALVDQIPVPTLVVHGADDTLVPTAASAPLARSITVERKVYPGLRHEIHFESDGPRVIGDIGDWIDAKLG